MDLIAEFIARYRKEYDFYEQACRMVAQALEANLRSAGVRAIVTSRAKNHTRLEAKVRQREIKRQYQNVSAIFEDIVDLAGVRVALYFPGERQEVGRIVRSLFDLTEDPKDFPTTADPSYKKRFSGYWATHYRVVLRESSLHESQQRYAEAKVEIQVASVLMHAWSEAAMLCTIKLGGWSPRPPCLSLQRMTPTFSMRLLGSLFSCGLSMKGFCLRLQKIIIRIRATQVL
ncbi:RelA/SpoT domain-containing protein [Pseudomonas sp. UFMG81]|uniref:RelA/SpoT domain-containing protein n=1 Tax=Pseudomonas sp. UFMG81 TaxID=2745936 RepID=UPI001E4E6A12|nr:RelA/SpoT domain-containing protein [Pseudomonas sp. UFMG81]